MSVLDSLFGDDATVLRKSNFQLLLLANTEAVVGTALLSPVLNSLIDPFGASPASIGLMISFYTAPAIVVIPISGVLADRYGRKSMLLFSLLLFGIAGTAIALTTDFKIALFLRLCQGIAFGGLVPVIITAIGDLYDGSTETTAQGLRFTGSGLSQAVFPLVAGLLVGMAWQFPFLLYALCVPIAVLMYIWFDEPVTDEEKNSPELDVSSYRRSLFRLARRRRVSAIVIARGLGTVSWIGFLTYNSILVVRLIGGTPGQAGLLVAVGSLVFAASASQAGRLSALLDSRLALLVAANCCLAVGFILALYAPIYWVAVAGIAVHGVGFGLAHPIYRSMLTGYASSSLRAGLIGIAESWGRITATITPIAMGAIISVATPVVGFVSAVRFAGLAAALVGGGGSLLCLLVLHVSPPVQSKTADVSGD